MVAQIVQEERDPDLLISKERTEEYGSEGSIPVWILLLITTALTLLLALIVRRWRMRSGS